MIDYHQRAAQIYMAEREKVWKGPPIDPIDKRKWVTNYLTNRFDELLGSGWREYVTKP